MNRSVFAVAFMATLALAACSSGTSSDTPAGDSTSASTSTATTSETTTAAANAGDTPADFCASVEGMTGIDANLLAATTKLNTAIEDSSTWEDPATLDALHATGQEVLDQIPGVVAFYETAASQADDAELSAAVLAMGDLYDTYFAAMAQTAVDATDVMNYATGILEISGDEEMSKVLSDATDAAYVVSDYAAANCT